MSRFRVYSNLVKQKTEVYENERGKIIFIHLEANVFISSLYTWKSKCTNSNKSNPVNERCYIVQTEPKKKEEKQFTPSEKNTL